MNIRDSAFRIKLLEQAVVDGEPPEAVLQTIKDCEELAYIFKSLVSGLAQHRHSPENNQRDARYKNAYDADFSEWCETIETVVGQRLAITVGYWGFNSDGAYRWEVRAALTKHYQYSELDVSEVIPESEYIAIVMTLPAAMSLYNGLVGAWVSRNQP